MTLLYFHSPFSRNSLVVLEQLFADGVEFELITRYGVDDNAGYVITALPTLLLVDRDLMNFPEIARITDVTKMNKAYIDEWRATYE